MIKRTKLILLTLIVLLSSLSGQGFPGIPMFEVGGGANLTMPRQVYQNGWGIALDGVWNFSRRYAMNLAYGFTVVDKKEDNGTRTISSVVGSLEISFRRGEFAHGFTSIGLGRVSGEQDALFVFGIGLKIPLRRNFLLRLELRDHYTDVGLPFAEFPEGRVLLQGRGTPQFLEFGVGVAFSFGGRL